MISIVVATDKNQAIGKENRIPWRLRNDLKNLRTLTLGHTVIIGRKTYDSMVWYYDKSGRTMPGKTYIIITRDHAYRPTRSNAQVAYSIKEALHQAEKSQDESIFVIGGATIYKALLPYTDRIYLTEVQTEIEGDTHFPKLNTDEWREVSRRHYTKDEQNQYDFDMIILERFQHAA